jgi:hypothetical protein
MSLSSRLSLKTLAVAVALTVGAAFSAVAADAPAPAAQAAPARGHVPILWKISDHDNTLYLLGSFHLLRASDLPLSPDIAAAMADAKSTMFELDMVSMMAPENLAKVQAYQKLQGDKPLSALLPPSTREKLEALLKVSGTPMSAVDGLDAWALSMNLTVGTMMAMGFTGDSGPDRQLSLQADKEGKPRLALETLDDEFGAMERTPFDEQVLGITKFVADPRQVVVETMKLHDQWMAGDVEGLAHDALARMRSETPQSYRLLVVDRNNAWLPQLKARLDAHHAGDNTLAVVGALHLAGEDGLLAKLRAEGYRVERICTGCATGPR